MTSGVNMALLIPQRAKVSDRMKWFLHLIIIIMVLLVRNKLEHAAYENKLIKETRKLRAAKMAAGGELKLPSSSHPDGSLNGEFIYLP